MAAKSTAQPTAVAIPDFQDDDFSSLTSFDDAVALLQGAGIELKNASDVLGSGFAVLKNKDLLIGVPFIAIQWRFIDGNNGRFAAVHVMAKMPGAKEALRYILVDGSLWGICKQLTAYTEKTGVNKGLLVDNGLSRSDYETEVNGEQISGTTYYLDTTAA